MDKDKFKSHYEDPVPIAIGSYREKK